jgi:hypothetical protein
MRKFGIIMAMSPAELREIADKLEERQEGHPDRFMRVNVNWYHSKITFVNPESAEIKEEMEATASEMPVEWKATT